VFLISYLCRFFGRQSLFQIVLYSVKMQGILTFFIHQEVYSCSGNRVIITVPVRFVENVRLVGLGSAVAGRLPLWLSTERRHSPKIATAESCAAAEPWLLAVVVRHRTGPRVRPLHVVAVVRIRQDVTAGDHHAQQGLRRDKVI